MQNFHILNSKGTKHLLELLKSQFGFTSKLDYAFLMNKDDIYIISRDLARLDTSKLRINNLGLYFGNLKDDKLRLSIEGSQLIGSKSGKNILTLDNEQILYWLAGDNLPVQTDLKGYVLIKHKDDYFGCGHISISVGNLKILMNYVPKERRLKLKNE